MVRQHKNDRLIAQLLVLFPGGDPGYFRSCLGYYETAPVERIAEKIFNNGGYYPRLLGSNTNNRTQHLNQALQLLATEFFPDCNVAYLRERLLRYDHSHVEQVANELLQRQDQAYPERLEYGKLDRSDLIKSEGYRAQAQAQLALDYPQVWKSSIRAVLAENNWDYVKSYDQLQDMGSGGFWTTIRNFIRHWSLPTSSTSFIASATSAGSSSKNNSHDDTGDDKEEFEYDRRIVRRRALDAQSAQDAKTALEISHDEYDELITCQCCYGDYVIEQLAFCSQGTHMFCHDCITRYISEGLFGQGALRGAARIPCISMGGSCDGCFAHSVLEHRILSQDIWSAYQKSVFEENMRACQSKIVRCSACGYCEIDESMGLPLHTTLDRLMVLVAGARWLMWDLKGDIETVYDRIACARRGSVFQCRNPECRRLTCVLCQHIVRGLHKCWEKEQDGLRLYVEKAMADAVKRTVRKR
ncbi:hypothetical protein BDB00DRAFT_846382 [Zychaea mexicana]|uniref:uncharacterized protein n=1 Tax=Zychaea mexicana TaxID=64656 RepID=UPI0022FDD4F5|nr:uncharacterized protein BDB00DRAFT_846382 [Zychaea mexicana]KAI9488849.1 hypothetical protein BDB00DRAFT_846382 [Zychaea mexicana]